MATKQLWALDFDGVVCDSCGESALSAWRAAEGLWPDMFTAEDVQSQKDDLMVKMRAVRPVVETGVHHTMTLLGALPLADTFHSQSLLMHPPVQLPPCARCLRIPPAPAPAPAPNAE